MSVKSKFGILTLLCVVAVSILFWYIQKEPYSAEGVVESVWDKYEVQSTQFGEVGDLGEEESVIWIDVYDKNDIPKVEEYLEDKTRYE